MGRKGWVAIGAVAIGATAFAFGRPHRIAAAPTAPAKSESEIRSLDIAFYERRIAEDSFSAADRSSLAGLYLQRARETGNSALRARRATRCNVRWRYASLTTRETYVLLTSALLAKHDFTAALRAARTLYAFDTTDASHVALLAEVELEVGDYDRAAAHFATDTADADKPSVTARLARWYEVTGRLHKAQAILRQSTARMARSSDVPREQLAWFHYRLGELYLRAGQHREADSLVPPRARGAPDRLPSTRWANAALRRHRSLERCARLRLPGDRRAARSSDVRHHERRVRRARRHGAGAVVRRRDGRRGAEPARSHPQGVGPLPARSRPRRRARAPRSADGHREASQTCTATTCSPGRRTSRVGSTTRATPRPPRSRGARRTRRSSITPA